MTEIAAPEHIRRFIEIIGEQATFNLIMELGGTGVYLPDQSARTNSALSQAVGSDKAVALGKALGRGHIKLPTAREWLAQYMHHRLGLTVAEVARRLHVKDQTASNLIKRSGGSVRDPRQGNLFGDPAE